jgi:hypothetical protein
MRRIPETKSSAMFERLRRLPKPVTLLNLLGASAVFILLLVMPPPPFISQTLNQSGWMILLLLAAIFAVLFRQKGFAWEVVQSVFVFGLFALLLIRQWQVAPDYGEIIGGLLPWQDASSYLLEAQHLLNGSLFSSFGGRPLFSSFLAVLLYITGGNFMVTLAMLTWVNALAAFLVVQEVRRSHGALGASVLLIFIYKFYLRFVGTAMTEQLGFAFGNLAVFFLLLSAQNRNLKHALLGLGMLSLALNARAGAFFILPILVIWLAITFYPRYAVWRLVALAAVAVALPFILNFVLLKAVALPQSAPFSNYSYILYGMASGNKDWSQVMIDHPNITESEIMPQALQKIRSNPAPFLMSIYESYRDYFVPLGGAFTFIVYSLYSFRAKANVILWLLALAGLAYSAFHWKKGEHALALASFAGIFASLTLVHPSDADGMRIYAATIPFTGLWVVEGLFALSAWSNKLFRHSEYGRPDAPGLSYPGPALVFTALLIIMAIPAPILLRSLARPSSRASLPSKQYACAPGQQLLQGFVLRNTRIILIPDAASSESYMPFIRISDFQSALVNSFSDTPFMGRELEGLQAGQQISIGYDLNFGSYWLVSNFPLEAGKFTACGSPSAANGKLRPYGFYTLEGAPVRPASLTLSQQYQDPTFLFRLLYGFGVGIIMVLIAMDQYKSGQRSMLENVYVIGATILILTGIFTALYTQAIIHIPFTEQRTTLQVKDAVPKKPTHLYVLPLGIDWMNQADLGLSPAVVYENGIPLAAPNSLHQAIKEDGNGGYSIWNGSLYFSSSDNTDPRTNGRKYELEWPHPLRPVLQWIAYMGCILGLAMLLLREWLMRTAGARLGKFRRSTDIEQDHA